jgi:hypothetical protein
MGKKEFTKDITPDGDNRLRIIIGIEKGSVGNGIKKNSRRE